MGRGWSKLLKNKTNVKVKIVERLFSLRKIKGEEFILDQSRIIGVLSNVWGSIRPTLIIHYNDREQLFGIVMTIEENRYMYQRLAEDCTTHQCIGDPNFSPKQIFQTIQQ